MAEAQKIVYLPEALRGLYAEGVNVAHSPDGAFELNFLVHDPADPGTYIVIQRVTLSQSSVPPFLNALNGHWNEYELDRSATEPIADLGDSVT